MKKVRMIVYFIIAIIVICIAIIYFTYHKDFRIITGYKAKQLSSWYFVSKRQTDSVLKYDLNFFPINLSFARINKKESKVQANLIGLFGQKAIYRKGLGCTLLTTKSAKEVREQSFIPIETTPENPDAIDWPQGNKVSIDLSNPITDSLKPIIDEAFDPPGKADLRTNAVVIVHKGKVIAEKYANGFTPNTPHVGWSMTKSIMNTLTGILVKENKLDLYGKVNIPEWENDNRNEITLNDLLQMSSGLEWTEGYEKNSDVTTMLYKVPNTYEYAIQSKSIHPTGTVWKYSSGTSNIISGIIRSTFPNLNDYFNFPRKMLFNKIGATSFILEPDAGGNFVGSSYSLATARDWAKLGQLYLNDGMWEGERILPEGWVEYSTTPAKHSRNRYGAQIWLNVAKSNLSNLPEDVFYFDGL